MRELHAVPPGKEPIGVRESVRRHALTGRDDLASHTCRRKLSGRLVALAGLERRRTGFRLGPVLSIRNVAIRHAYALAPETLVPVGPGRLA